MKIFKPTDSKQTARWIPIRLKPDPKWKKQFPGRRHLIVSGWYMWDTLNFVADTSKVFELKKEATAACQRRSLGKQDH